MRLPLTGRPQMLAYSVGNLGYTGYAQIIAAFFIFFLVEVVRLDPWLAGLAFAISFGAWNAINDTLIGILSDKTNTRLGRRRPWILVGAPLTLLFSVFIWTPPLGGEPLSDPWNMGVFVFATMMLFSWSWTYSMAAIPWYALLPAMWHSVKDRTEVTIWKELIGVVGGAVAIMIFPIVVVALSSIPFEVTTVALPDGIMGTHYHTHLNAEGGNEPYEWSLEEGSALPYGLSLDSSGTLSGTPEFDGDYTFTVKVSDDESEAITENVNINIREKDAAIAVATRTVAEGQKGEGYEVVLEVAGGVPPYTWSISNGTLPYGVELNSDTGSIAGEPTDEAKYVFTVTVSDSATPPNQAVKQLSIEILEYEKGSLNGWTLAGLIISIIFSVAFLFALLGAHEPKGLVLDKSWSILRSFKITFVNKTFISFMMVNLMAWCIFMWLTAMVPFFITHCLGLGLSEMPLLFAPVMIGIFIFFPFWRKIYINRGPKFTLAISSIITVFAFIPCLIVQNTWQGAIWAFCVGAAVSGVLLARSVMTADLPDADELATGGAKREGAYYGAVKAGEKMAFVIVGLSSSLVLATFIGYVAGQPKPEFMDMGIRIGMMSFAAIYVAIMLVFLWIYPLGKKEVEAMGTKLQEIRAKKEGD